MSLRSKDTRIKLWKLLIGLAMVSIMGFVLIAIVNAYITAPVPEGQSRLGNFFSTNYQLAIPLLVIVILLVAFGARAISTVMTNAKMERPEIVLSKDAVRPGEKFQVTYRQSFKQAVDVEEILIQLVMIETDFKRKGKDLDRTNVHFERRYPGRHYKEGQLFEDSLEMQIPADGKPTFENNDTIIQWYVEVEVKFARSPDYREGVEIRVLPEMEPK